MPRLYPVPALGSRDEPGRWRHAYVDPTRSGVQFWNAIRLQIQLKIGPDPRRGQRDRRDFVTAFVDTGAYLTVFSQDIWSEFTPSLIRFLDPAPQSISVPLSVAGHRCPVRLGWIWLGWKIWQRPGCPAPGPAGVGPVRRGRRATEADGPGRALGGRPDRPPPGPRADPGSGRAGPGRPGPPPTDVRPGLAADGRVRGMLPFGLRRLGFEPATNSAPRSTQKPPSKKL